MVDNVKDSGETDALDNADDPIKEKTPSVSISVIPSYEKYSNARITAGAQTKNYEFSQRYTYVNINPSETTVASFTGKSIGLRNLVTLADVDHEKLDVKEDVVEQKGGLYFKHGFDAYDAEDIVSPDSYDNVDLAEIAKILINQPEFELKMTGHADRSGDAAGNQKLSENRVNTAKELMINALEDQGLSEDDAAKLYKERVAPNTTYLALGENAGPEKTEDGVKSEANRVVVFDLLAKGNHQEQLMKAIHKGSDSDNHDHLVVAKIGTSFKRREVDFFPNQHKGRIAENQHKIADEEVSFVFKIDENRTLDKNHVFTLNYRAANNLTADNVKFTIEHERPGAVTSAYNPETKNIEMSIDGQVAVAIKINSWIDPAVIRVGQMSPRGTETIKPLTNLEDVAEISASKKGQTSSNPLYTASNELVLLSHEAKKIFIEHNDDPAGYEKAIEEFGFEEKVEEALLPLKNLGINTGLTEASIVSQYMLNEDNPGMYHPDLLLFPIQIHQALYETEVGFGGMADTSDHKEAVKLLLDKVNDGLKTAGTDAHDHDSTSPTAIPGMTKG